MRGSQYYKILGLAPTATDAEVKKRFRTLAKEYHPDTNPDANATAVFQEMLDAYERIMKKDFGAPGMTRQQNQPNSRTSNENAHRDFHRKAWERYERMRKEQERELNDFYETFIKGPKMTIKRMMAAIAGILFCCLMFDEFAPTRNIREQVVSYNQRRYQSVGDHFVNEIVTKSGNSYFVADYQPSKFETNPIIQVRESHICRLIKQIDHRTEFGMSHLEVHFSFYWLRWVLYTFLLITLLMPFYKKRSTILVLGTWFTFYIVGLTIVLFLFSNFRIASLLTAGNWP